ncbi:FAD-linked oxidoreductase-like protein [Aspergillus karnatakaensis]|uniref:proline dehydrogenase family protein n=1 Tax=Aspergillus karnatakaensis TaxID=1810916 RepID=UPI003CCD1A0A
MVILSAGKPAIPRVVAFTQTRGISTLNTKPNNLQRGRSSSTSSTVFPEIKSTQETAAKAPLPPLSALPTTVLLRSLLVATISSKPYLLLPSLSALSFLCKPRKGPLLNVDRNPILHAILKSTFYKQFCAGETHNEVRNTIQQLNNMGFQGTIMTYAKETVFDHKTNTQVGLGIADSTEGATGELFCQQIEAWRTGTMETVELLGENDYLAMKLTGAGPTVTTAFTNNTPPPPQMLSALHEICTRCKERGVRILVDAESHHFLAGMLSLTLDLMRQFNTDGYASVYMTYQAYLKSTPATLAKHLAAASEDGFTLGLKLVRGAYIASDERSLIHDTKADTDNAYNSIAQGALKQELGGFGIGSEKAFPSVNLFLASHNRESVLSAHTLHQQRLKDGLPTVPVGFAQLHGMSDEVSFSLLSMKGKGVEKSDPKVYKCSTWGGLGECLAYLLRRAIENRDAVGRTGDEFKALKGEVGRRVRGVFFG